MKQLLFVLISLLIVANLVHAQEQNPIEETTWNVIRERLFNKDNSKAVRFEEDIRFQLIGAASAQDSGMIKIIVNELDELIELVDVKFVAEHGNFVFTIYPPENGISSRINFKVKENTIVDVEVDVNAKNIASKEDKWKFFVYHAVRYLTSVSESKFGRTGYNGIFDSNSFEQSGTFGEIDKDLIRKLYSNDFYKQLRKNTVKKLGYLYYLNLRYEGWVRKISMSIAIFLLVLGFLFLLSKESNSIAKPSLWNYLKKGSITLAGISVVYFFYKLAYFIPFFEFVNVFYSFVINFVEVFLYGITALILIFYSEKYFLNKFSEFFQKQIFVFFSTVIFIFLSYAIVSLPFALSNSQSSLQPISYTGHIKLTILFDILIFAFLRVLYNFIKHKMQSIVNQKDVELAKMKELKNQAELNALHSRINPHFLYNSLNSIAGLAHTNPDKTENMATALSELFRYSINKEDKTFVRIDEELEMVGKYLEIEKTRFGDRLVYEIKADDVVQDKLIPKFLIQPLAENAIKHGLSKMMGKGKIRIEIKQLANDLQIAIFDNGPDFPDEPVSGYGLQNLNDKLQIIYGDEAFTNWENGANKHFKITLKNQF